MRNSNSNTWPSSQALPSVPIHPWGRGESLGTRLSDTLVAHIPGCCQHIHRLGWKARREGPQNKIRFTLLPSQVRSSLAVLSSLTAL